MRLTEYECDPKQLSPLTLAFIGDGVYDLFVTEEETDIFRRGRNAHTSHAHKRTREYHYATGLEALFGYLYLSGNAERIRTLLSISDT